MRHITSMKNTANAHLESLKICYKTAGIPVLSSLRNFMGLMTVSMAHLLDGWHAGCHSHDRLSADPSRPKRGACDLQADIAAPEKTSHLTETRYSTRRGNGFLW